MKTSEFNFDLPDNLIAQYPTRQRDHSRLLVLNRCSGKVEHSTFSNLIPHLTPDDVLVFNNTKVINARIKTQRKSGGTVECLLLEPLDTPETWLALLKPAKRLTIGETLVVNQNFQITIIKKNIETGIHTVTVKTSRNIYESLCKVGEIPLPPYIKTTEKSLESEYQTVFAKEYGAIAAPTAGRHFTKELLQELRKNKIDIETITLHIGYGTFKPIQTKKIEDHKMHEERYFLTEETAKRLTDAHRHKNIIAVGTTVTRTLESAFDGTTFKAGPGKTDLFITPEYSFKAIDGLITNFHLPQSSLLILVSSFCSKHHVLQAYNEAVQKQYRFFSFGDAMLIR